MKQSYFDLVDEDDNPTGSVATYDEVHDQGLWHRGVHVILYTPEKEILMQKRSPSLLYQPNKIEVSAGGGVDAGETPQQAIIREVREELGIHIRPDQLRFLGKTKSNHHTKTQINRVFIYSYAVCLPKGELITTLDPNETTKAFFITVRKLRRALIIHRIRNVGKISSRYAFWNYLLDAI